MNYTDLLPYLLPALLISGIVVYHIRKNKKGFLNAFRAGSPFKLQQEISIECFIPKEDFVKTNEQLTPGLIKSKWVKIWVGVVVFLVAFNVIFTIDFRHFRVSDLSLLGLFIPVILFFGISYLTKLQSEKNYDSAEFIKHIVTYTFTPTGYEYTNPVTSGSAIWETIQGYSDTTDYLVVYTGTIQALFLPKSAFTVTNLEIFTKFLESNFEFRKKVM